MESNPIGSKLRGWRITASLDGKDAARHLNCHPSKISRIERGTQRPSADDVRNLGTLYGIPDASVNEVVEQLPGSMPALKLQEIGELLDSLVAEWRVLDRALTQSERWSERRQAVPIGYCWRQLDAALDELGLPRRDEE